MEEPKQIKINKLDSKVVDGANGSFEVHIINDKWESAIGNWNRNWKVGDTVKGIFTEVVGKNGQTYYRIKCPPELKSQYGGGNQIILNQILQEILIVKNLIQEKKAPEEAKTDTVPDETPTEPEINVEDIPF